MARRKCAIPDNNIILPHQIIYYMKKRNKFNGRDLYFWSEALGVTADCIRKWVKQGKVKLSRGILDWHTMMDIKEKREQISQKSYTKYIDSIIDAKNN